MQDVLRFNLSVAARNYFCLSREASIDSASLGRNM